MPICEINRKELAEWQATGKPFQLIDVREPTEHQQYNIGGELIPFADLGRKLDRLARDRPVVLYCKRGIRSTLLIQRYAARHTDIAFYNLQGGIGSGEGKAPI